MSKPKWNQQVNNPSEEWARVKDFRDPVSGKPLNSIGDTRPQSAVDPRPAGGDTTSARNPNGST